MYKTLLTDISDNILTVTIHRPDKLNAINKDVMSELDEVVTEIYSNKDIRSAIITGSGQKAFVAGADISEFIGLTAEEGQALSVKGHGIFSRIAASPKPIAAAVNGFALGGGCEFALGCTMRIASKNARLGQPETKLGLLPGFGGSQRLSRLCGKGVAHELILTGEMISADEALRIGLVNRVVEPADLLPTAEAIAKKIIANAPLAVKYAMEAIEHGMDMTLEEGLFLEAILFGVCCSTEDMREGTRAFLEKRPAKFQGR